MGGKGRRRREKNYRAAHGGYTRLPPAPDPSKVDALPSKLRKLMSLTSQSQGDSKVVKNVKDKKKNGNSASELVSPFFIFLSNYAAGDDGQELVSAVKGEFVHVCNKRRKKSNSKVEVDVDITGIKDRLQDADNSDGNANNITNEKRKKKRKRKQVEDLRFETLNEKSDASTKRRERKKKYLEARKNKHKRARTEENLEFPGHEKIKFGDIVQAPPKLLAVPKAFKNLQDASKERVRLQAIQSYRERKGWTSRPGNQLPNTLIAPMEL
nr:coiled-coil domain-containing protein 137 isoform X1 [Ziziphus jujuba var. spinosa]